MPTFRREGKVEHFPMKFCGLTISKDGDSFCIYQQEYADSLEKISINNFSEKYFGHLRGQLGYVASSTSPDVAYSCAILSQAKASESSAEQVKILNS